MSNWPDEIKCYERAKIEPKGRKVMRFSWFAWAGALAGILVVNVILWASVGYPAFSVAQIVLAVLWPVVWGFLHPRLFK